jgi:epoxyqueuosine reductase
MQPPPRPRQSRRDAAPPGPRASRRAHEARGTRAVLPTPPEIKAAIRAEALRLGFAAVGFADAALAEPARTCQREALADFIDRGLHGDMGWMETHADRRAAPDSLWPEAQTVVSLGMNYAPRGDPLAVLERSERAAISVYAQSRDYHDVVKARLKQLGRFIHDRYGMPLKVFVDTAPVMEKPAAMRAGIGWQGKHTNLVSRTFGSWLFLGEILLSVALPPDESEQDHCGSCHACLDICPTAAFPAPYRLDPRRCLSYLTIEHKGPIPHEFRQAMGNRIYGCDDCLAVCPWNKFALAAHDAALAPRPALDAPALVELAALDDAAFRALFAGTAIKRTGRDRFVRNVAIALGNCRDGTLALSAIERLLDDASPLVRGAAAWALSRHAPAVSFAAQRARRLAVEADEDVRREWHP